MIKIKKGYILRHVLDIYLVMGIGNDAYNPNCIMSVNETGAFIWEKLETGAEKEQLVTDLTAEFEIDEATAKTDLDTFLSQLYEKAIIEIC